MSDDVQPTAGTVGEIGKPPGLMEIRINGQACHVGHVQFESPKSYTALLKPFVKVKDGQGNRYHVKGLLGLVIAIESAKKREPAGVLCLKEGDGAYSVVRWF